LVPTESLAEDVFISKPSQISGILTMFGADVNIPGLNNAPDGFKFVSRPVLTAFDVPGFDTIQT